MRMVPFTVVFSLVVYEPKKYARFIFDRQFAPSAIKYCMMSTFAATGNAAADG